MPKITQERRDKRRDVILDSAFDLFSSKGYKETSMRDIIDACGYSKGGLYTHFSSKEAIFKALLLQRDQRRHALKDDIDVFAPVESFLEARLRLLKDEKNVKWARLLIGYWMQTRIVDEKRFSEFEISFTDLIELGVKSAIYKTCDCKEVARVLMAIVNGYGVLVAMGHPITDEHINLSVKMVSGILRG
jgi:AcrR family transcriptional regulator